MKRRIACLTAAVGALLLVHAAAAQQQQQPAAQQPAMQQPAAQKPAAQQPAQKNQPGNLSPGDRQFLEAAYSINEGEVRLGELAKRKGTTDEVKNYGQYMVSDHTLALKELREFADKANARVPNQLLPEQQRLYDQMSRLSGEQFDRAYINHMVSGHETAIGVFDREAQFGKNQVLREYAQKTLPMLNAHENVAKFDQTHPKIL